MPPRRLLATLAGLAAFAAVGTGVAHAAGGVPAGAEAIVTTACTDAGVRADFEIAGQSVSAVTVAGLPSSCLGQTVTVTVARDTGADVTASATVGGGSTRVALAAPVNAADVTSLGVLVAR
jgi:hypothetical protein